jgi:DHA1 family bicyclomycin/chloramphenicol resistance-like MFS transporter
MSSAPTATSVTGSPPTTPRGRAAAVLVLLLGGLTALGPFTIDTYLSAFPDIARDLDTSDSRVQLTLTAALTGLALGQLVVGPLSDRWGRRRPLLLGGMLYTAASLGCAVAPSAGVLTAVRLVQGLAGAAGVVIARAVVRDLYDGVAAVQFFSRLMLVSGLAPVLAPVLGSALLQVATWRQVFVALAVLGGLLLLAVLLLYRETLPAERRTTGGLAETGRILRILARDRVLVGYALAAGLAFAAMFAYIAGSPFVVQDVYGAGTGTFAAMFATNALGLMAAGQVNARLVARIAPRTLLIGALTAQATGGILLLLDVLLDPPGGGGLDLVGLLPPLFVVVASLGFAFPNATALALARHPQTAGSASALLGTLQFVIGAAAAPLTGGGSAIPLGVVVAALATGALVVLLAGTAGEHGVEPVPAAQPG